LVRELVVFAVPGQLENDLAIALVVDSVRETEDELPE
jgi:hypothetical protein